MIAIHLPLTKKKPLKLPISAFMAQEDEVQDYDELLEAFNELYNDFKNEKIKNKVLIKENERLNNENTIYVSQISSLDSQNLTLKRLFHL